jgi:hypothetical protein
VRNAVDPVQGTWQGVGFGCEPEEADDPVHVDEEDRPLWQCWFQGFTKSLLR